jgi:hypothetical protein
MAAPKAPAGLDARGRKLWREVLAGYDLEDKPAELAMLEEACRIADRLERLDELLRGDAEVWTRIRLPREDGPEQPLTLVIDSALSEARQQANIFKQLVAALRLPDEKTGKRPQQRGGARGAYQGSGAGAGNVTALDRARARSGA